MKKIIRVWLILLLTVSVQGVVGASGTAEPAEVHYFYISACEVCHEAETFLAALSDQWAPVFRMQGRELHLYRHNTAEGEALNLLNQYFEVYQVPESERVLPAVFFGNRWITGADAIAQRLATQLPATMEGPPPGLEQPSGDKASEAFHAFHFYGAISAGFLNGLTPCALSMLLFFISLLIAREVSVLRMGLMYCLGKFVTYGLLGTLLFGLLKQAEPALVTRATRMVMLLAVALFAVLNLLDYLAARNEKYGKIRLQLPSSLRAVNHRWIHRAAGAERMRALAGFSFLLGGVTSVGEFLCTGQIYLSTILYVLHQQQTFSTKAVLFFSGYSLAFVMPLLLLTLLIHFGRGVLEVSELVRKHLPLIKLMNTLLFLAYGIWLVTGI